MAKICFLADADSIHTRKWVEFFSNFDNEIYLISMRETTYKYNKNVTYSGHFMLKKVLNVLYSGHLTFLTV